MDTFDPHDNNWLMICLKFRNIFNMREHLARKLDVNRKIICSDNDILLLSKAKITA